MRLYKIKLLIGFFLAGYLLICRPAAAMMPGTLLYRTSSHGQMYGYSSRDLLKEKFGLITNIYSGHAGIYIGQEEGVDYVVEALGNGIVKTPAQYFVNENNGEKLVAAKIPTKATSWQRAKAVALAKYLASADLGYDFDFSAQKGPGSGDWTCVGLTEKLYESANADNPERLGALEYNQQYYAVNITPDGYDRDSLYNDQGDCFSTRREFSRIARRSDILLPAPEKIGYDAGKEYNGDRYIFIPYTQALQTSLKDETVDIDLSSVFPEEAIRGKVSNLGLILKWSLINNPVSSVKKIAGVFVEGWNDLFSDKKQTEELTWDESPASALKLQSETISGNENIEAADANKSSFSAAVNPALSTTLPAKTIKKTTAKNKKTVAAVTADKNNQSLVGSEPASISSGQDIFSTARPAVADSQKNTDTAAVNSQTNSSASIPVKTAASKKNVALWSPVAAKLTSTTAKTTTTDTKKTKPKATSTVKTKTEAPLTLVISRLYTIGDDDWLEIWNYGEEDIDLAARKVRLEKSRTAADPGIILRFDVGTDASFPGGKVIRAGEGYRIVRNKAAADLRAAAQAIASRTDFNLADSGYTIYLASGPVSSANDADIIDFVGYGQAKYFEGAASAPADITGYLLRRKADAGTQLAEILADGEKANWPPLYDSNNNSRDWLLWPLGGVIPEPVEEDEEDGEDEDDNVDEDNNNEQGNSASSTPFTLLPGVDSSGLWRLWSFEECRGSSTAEMISGKMSAALSTPGTWTVGRWGCAQAPPYRPTALEADLDPLLSGETFTLAFQFKGDGDYANPYFYLSNTEENIALQLYLYNTMMEFHGFPGLEGRYDCSSYMDNAWHQGVLVWNAGGGYWSLSFDGQEIFHQDFSGLAPGFNRLTIGAVAGLTLIDDVALWNRALSQAEIKNLAVAAQPFNPQPERETPSELQLLHAWNFDEASGTVAHDSVGGLDWSLPANALVYDGLSGRGLDWPPLDTKYQLSLPAWAADDFSASWWWQNTAPAGFSGRMQLLLKEGDESPVNFSMNNWRQQLNGNIWSEGYEVLPKDDLWHHLALVYDDYRYRWQLFVDGKLKLEKQDLPLDITNLDGLSLATEVTGFKLDNLKLWQGSLDAAKVLSEYEAEKPQ